MPSTCSVDQASILSDLTLEMWVPSLRWIEAHRIHRKMPKFQLAHPGFLAPQSAQTLLPGTVLSSSCKIRSLRACCLRLMAVVILEGRCAVQSSEASKLLVAEKSPWDRTKGRRRPGRRDEDAEPYVEDYEAGGWKSLRAEGLRVWTSHAAGG